MKSGLIISLICLPYLLLSQSDSLALVAFYRDMDGEHWTTTWDLHQPLSTWYGLDMANNRVYGISLLNNNLKGELSDAILDLTEMRNFQIGNDSITGTIPDSIQKMKQLQFFYCTNSQLSGSIPPSFGDLENITSINLARNQLSDTLPGTLAKWKNLLDFDVSNNQLTGSIPVGMGENSLLRTFNISANHFTGTIPEDFKDAKNLEEFIVFRNELTGFPNDLMAHMEKLRRAQFSENDFTGPFPILPASIESFSCVDNHFTGAIPGSIKSLAQLNLLDIRDNNLNEIPDFHGHPSLQSLDIGGNEFTFEDVLPNIGAVEFFTYAGMKPVGKDTVIDVASGTDFTYVFAIDTSISNKTFHFFRDQINWMSSADGLLAFPNFSILDTGTYYVEITHPDAPELTLMSHKLKLTTQVTTNRPNGPTTISPTIYPNPAWGSLHVRGLNHLEKVVITDVLGHPILEQTTGTNGELLISELDPGLYLLHISGKPAVRFIKL